MLCSLCMKDVDWLIPVKQHRREHPMTYIVTQEICIKCLGELFIMSEEKPKAAKKEGKDVA